MTPLELVEQARALGVTLEPAGPDRLRVRPSGRLTPELRAELIAHKAAVLRLLAVPSTTPAGPDTRGSGRPDPAEVARVLGLPLARLDRVLRVAVPWLDGPLWFVPTQADAETLVATGEATRGAVWTRRELLDLMAIPNITKAGARRVAEAKLAFNGDVTEVRDTPSGEGDRR